MKNRISRASRAFFALPALLALAAAAALPAQQPAKYFPPPGQWQRKSPADVGMDSAKLQLAVAYAQAHGSSWDFERDQVRDFGAQLGPLPKERVATNGVIIRHGYIVAEFGDTKANDPIYSAAKSFVSSIAALAVDRGLIKSVDDPVGSYIKDGGYDSPHNAKITWKNHLQQESEWEGTMWGKNADFVGAEQFGAGEMKPRPIQEPGTLYEYNDVRINRLALSLTRLFGTGLPDVLKTGIMDPIGASQDWRWIPYDNAHVDIGGRTVGSVSGGTRWGGGLWINSEDMARYGLLMLNRGAWGSRRIVSDDWFRQALTPSAHGPGYGYLWWLNPNHRLWRSAPESSFAAMGTGSNSIWIDPDDDIVFVWHWGGSLDPMIQQILAAVTGP